MKRRSRMLMRQQIRSRRMRLIFIEVKHFELEFIKMMTSMAGDNRFDSIDHVVISEPK